MSRMVLMGGVALVASFVMGATAIGAAQQPKPIPNFMFVGSGWLGQGGTNFIQPKSGPGPIKNDPKFPYVGNNDTPGNQSTERVGDASDPILQPWAADVVRQHNDLVHKGKRSFVAQARCWPGGGPAQLLFPAEPIFFIQRPQEVHIIWQRDHHVRRVRMNVPHGPNLKPSWFGDFVGHYEATLWWSTRSASPRTNITSSTISVRRTASSSTWSSAGARSTTESVSKSK